MVRLNITAAIALLCVSGLVQAGGHTNAEAKIEKLQQDKKFLATRLTNAIAYSTAREAELEAANSKQMAVSAGISNAIAQSKKKSAQIAMLQQQLDSEKKKSKFLGTRLSNAIAYSTETETQMDAANSKQIAMSAGIAGALTQSKKKSARITMLQQQLDSEKSKSKFLGTRLSNAIAYSTKTEAQLDSQQQEQSDWASTVSANLNAAIGGVQGTTVTNIDNDVNVQVGNNGLFSTGGTALSAGGSQLLSTIAQQLSAFDANVTVVGHTDNVPVGESSRFSSNDELSFARAISTLQFLRDQGIPTEQLSAAGFGAGSPVAGNDTEEGRAQNRRVELVLRKQ